MKIRVHLPEDMTDITNKIAEFQAKKLVNMCTPQQVEAVIKYLKENKDDPRWKN